MFPFCGFIKLDDDLSQVKTSNFHLAPKGTGREKFETGGLSGTTFDGGVRGPNAATMRRRASYGGDKATK